MRGAGVVGDHDDGFAEFLVERLHQVQDFLGGLKVGDRIITTGGLYGQVTRLGEQSIQIQIADKVKIEVARASIGGYQGQEPVQEPVGARDN